MSNKSNAKRVFLCSTTQDLGKVREAVADALKLQPDWKPLNEENFGAQASPPAEYCTELIRQCDLFVAIVGHLYGTRAGLDKSFVELEYETAEKEMKPRLVYIAADELRSAETGQSSADRRRQETFRTRLRDSRKVNIFPFRDLSRLPFAILVGILNWGWDRFPAAEAEHIHLPPFPHLRHEYWKLGTFSGRRKQRELLSRWLRNGEETVFVLKGGPGMGKSALAWIWLHEDVLGFPTPGLREAVSPISDDVANSPEDRPEGLVRWSFDDDARFGEKEPPFHAFLRHALVYASGGEVRLGEEMPPQDRLERLRPLLRDKRVLFVLDGFERELNAFDDGSMPGDTVAGSPHGKSWRDCNDALARRFLWELASRPMNSRFLICTRVVPKAVEGDDELPLAFCRIEAIPRMNEDDAAELAHAQGIGEAVISRAQLAALCDRHGGSPLGLQLVARQIRFDLRDQGKVRLSEYEPSALSEEEEIEETFSRSYDSMSPPLQEILSTIAAFRGPADSEVLESIVGDGVRPRLRRMLRDLENTELVSLSARGWDMHPLLRHYARQRARNRTGIHRNIAEYWRKRLNVTLKRQLPEPGRTGSTGSKVPTREELMHFVELYHHLLHAGYRIEAFVLFAEHLWPPLSYAYSDLGLLRELLTEAFDTSFVADLPDEMHEAEVFALNQLANVHRMGGAVVQAVWLHQTVVDWDRRKGKERRKPKAIRQELLGLSQIHVGHYQSAEEELREALDLSRELERTAGFENATQAACLRDLGRLYIRTGDFSKALEVLEEAEGVAGAGKARPYLAPIFALRSRALLRSGGSTSAALDLANAALDADKGARHQAEAYLARGEARTAIGDLDLALEDLQKVLQMGRELNLFEIEIMATTALGRFHLTTGDLAAAHESTSQALRLACLGEYIGLEADAHLLLAEIHERVGRKDDARSHAELARDRSSQRLDLHDREPVDNALVPGQYDADTRGRAEELLSRLG